MNEGFIPALICLGIALPVVGFILFAFYGVGVFTEKTIAGFAMCFLVLLVIFALFTGLKK